MYSITTNERLAERTLDNLARSHAKKKEEGNEQSEPGGNAVLQPLARAELVTELSD